MKITAIMKKVAIFLVIFTAVFCAGKKDGNTDKNKEETNRGIVSEQKKGNNEKVIKSDAASKRYTGGYIDGFWYVFYNNTPSEKKCLTAETEDDGFAPEGCTNRKYVSFNGDLKIIGVAELNGKVILKLSDYRMSEDNGNVYTPYDYPSETKNKDGKYFPVFVAVKDAMIENLKEKNLKLNFTGKTWEEEYYTDEEESTYMTSSVFEKYISDKKNYHKKKIKFSGVEEMKVAVPVVGMYHYTIDNHLCADFSGMVDPC